MYELGELHRCRGDLAAAEQSLASACGYGVDALPGLALLRLTKDRATDARAALDTALAEAAASRRMRRGCCRRWWRSRWHRAMLRLRPLRVIGFRASPND